MKSFLQVLWLSLLSFTISAQTATIKGKITDSSSGEGIELVTIYIKGSSTATNSDLDGNYEFNIPAETNLAIGFTRTGYEEQIRNLRNLKAGSETTLDIQLSPTKMDIEVEVTEGRLEDAGIIREDVTELKILPTTTGNLESVLPAIALGTSGGTGGELSSQYNVRGGNYDENLVYVNDFEIYRPQLIRAGQQEGLTFPNIDLINSLSFSSGGFEAKYGDKLSSVLDVKYKIPDSLKASVGLSFLGGSAHLEGSKKIGSDKYRKFRYLFGARYKTTQYLLGTLDTQGEYTPNFADIQAYLTYDISRDWQVGLLANFNRAEYLFVPRERSTALGLIDFALELFSVFEGQEVDDFTTYFGGVSLTYLPDRSRNPFFLKFLASSYQSNENERFDIIGFYRLGQIESGLGADNFGEVVSILGTGTQQQFVRNYLQSNVTNVEHKGGYEIQLDDSENKTTSHFLQWSLKYQHERIDDQINEWERLDSAGYSLTYDPNEVLLNAVFKSTNILESNRISAFVQETFTSRLNEVREIKASVGVRATYWDLNNELVVSPRAQILYKPLRWEKDISFRLAAGLYAQPPFYRELRNLQGVVSTDVKAQKSMHFVGGLNWDFKMGKDEKQFKFISEIYYKRLWDLVSYDIENVRIRYSGQNDATGYVAGLDMRINGEFVPGTESWINISFLRARESLDSIQHLRRTLGEPEAFEVDDVPRPTDQFMTLSMFFQDYLPMNENFRMHLNFTVGTGLPYGFPGNNEVFRNTYRFRPYHRIDIGFSYLLWDQDWRNKKPKHFLRFTRRTWLSLEVFNLMQVSNTASNTWIKTITNVQYAIPNNLTSRRINLRMRVDF